MWPTYSAPFKPIPALNPVARVCVPYTSLEAVDIISKTALLY